jgi:hypothetical protein
MEVAMVAGQVAVTGIFSTGHDLTESLALAKVALARRGAKVTIQPDALVATGGRRIAYRLIGSRSARFREFMPWRAELRFTRESPTGCRVHVSIASKQGWYAYQGEPTRKKWERLLASIQEDVVAELGALPA